MKNRRILCFDCDGVIIDNTSNGYKKIYGILAELGLPAIDEEFLQENWGMKADELFTLICQIQGATDDQIVYFKRREKEIHMGGRLDKKLLRSIASLPDFGFIPAMITNRSHESLKKYARELDLDLNLFHYIQTTDDYPVHKPDGGVFKPLLQWAHDLGGFTAENIAYFGDTISSDYTAVKNAHCQGQMIKFVGVCSGITTFKKFVEIGLPENQIIPSHDVLSFYLNRLIQVKAEA